MMADDMTTIKIIDYGISSEWRDNNGNHIAPTTKSKMKGTPIFTSMNQHYDKTYSRRDDLESVGYLILDL